MNAPQVDRAGAIAAELGRLGRRLDELGAELAALSRPAPQPAAPPLPPPLPPPPAPPVRPPRERGASLSGARLLAWTGGGVTLLGVVLFLVLAASRGWFAPQVRVGAGALLGVVLVGVAVRLHRRPAARIGAVAVAGTGVAALYLDVAAATALYGYLPVPAGLLAALLVATVGLGLADRWRSALLGGGAVVGAALLAPVVTEGPTPVLVALVLVLQAVSTVVALRRAWPGLAASAAAWPVLYGVVVAVLDRPADRWGTALAVTAVLLLDLAGAVWADRTGRTGPVKIVLAAVAALPLLLFAGSVGGGAGTALAVLAALLHLAVAVLPGDRVLRTVAFAAGSVALFEATVIAFDGGVRVAVLLTEGVLLLLAAGRSRARAALGVAGSFAGLSALLATAGPVPPRVLVAYPAGPFALGTAAVVSVLLLATAGAVLVAATQVRALVAGVWVPAGLVGLYGGTGLVIACAQLAAPGRAAFVGGHAVVTVLWTVVAMVLLARGIRRPALRVAGLVLVAASVAKLVLFDLVALDGLARVAAFLGAGLLLLAAGARYARWVAETAADDPAAART